MARLAAAKSTLLRTLNRMYSLYPGQRAEGRDQYQRRQCAGARRDLNAARSGWHGVPEADAVPDVDLRQHCLRREALRKLSKSDMDDRVEWALKKAALWNEAKDKLSQSGLSLSGGQQQRLHQYRARHRGETGGALLDEPTSALDPISTRASRELVSELRSDYTIVIVTHNMQQAARVSQHTADICELSGRAGRVHADGADLS